MVSILELYDLEQRKGKPKSASSAAVGGAGALSVEFSYDDEKFEEQEMVSRDMLRMVIETIAYLSMHIETKKALVARNSRALKQLLALW